jgi:anti-sigma factor RsiW
MSEGNVTEADLQAYMDGQLDAAGVARVENFLARDFEAAGRVAAYIEQTHDLRAAFAHAAVDPDFAIPEPAGIGPRRMYRRPIFQAAAAAVLLGFVVGGGGGWMARSRMPAAPLTGIPALTQEAVENHLVFTSDHGRPVELAADKQDDLVRWLSKRLNSPVIVPDLRSAGYQFMGGRLAATPHGPAAMLMYVDANGERLTIFTRPMPTDQKTMGAVPISADGVSGFAWICDGRGYSVLQGADAGSLRSVADIVRQQVDPS